jgi:hypothetical protein
MSDESGENGAAAASVPLKVFLSYRRADSAAATGHLFDELKDKFGADNVFFDQTLAAGRDWREAIDAAGASCSVLIALIGPRWEEIRQERARDAATTRAVDYTKREIEQALSRGSGVEVIPVLVGEARLPDRGGLPRSLRPLLDLQAAPLRDESYEDYRSDVEKLCKRLDAIALEHANRPALPPAPLVTAKLSEDGDAATTVAPHPDPRHYGLVTQAMVDEGALVVLLGSRVNASDRAESWHPGTGRLPDTNELAVRLAARLHLVAHEPDDLASVAQQAWASLGGPPLYRTLKEMLPRDPSPGAVHQFFARLPQTLKQLGHQKCHQLIVTTNYDTALEGAFDDEPEPYDLVLYMASGENKGKFVHFPFDRDPEVIDTPNIYDRFPIDDDGYLTRTVILKIHGAVDGGDGKYAWTDNYVITEDQYIAYMSRSKVDNVIPVQILQMLKEGHWLFLGYTVRDWNLRVFLNRIWDGVSIEATSWAVQRDPEGLDKDLWSKTGVELFASSLVDYLAGLSEHLGTYPAAET